jgi:preprotein translocase subunit Sec61beta
LPQAYRYKEIGDYSLDPDAVITIGHAEAAIISAAAFVAIISAAAFINGVRNALV